MNIEVLNAIRDVLEEHALKKDSLEGFCAVAAKLCEQLGQGRFAYGQVWYGNMYTEHCWNVKGDYLVDVTATQFRGPRIFIHNQNEPLPLEVKYVEVGVPNFRLWPEEQKPHVELLTQLRKEVLMKLNLPAHS